MPEVKVKTNNHQRQFICRYDVPSEVLKNQFSHISEDDGFCCFLKYKGWWYHASDFMSFWANGQPSNAFGGGWDGYSSDSFFSGVLIKVSDDQDTYIIATFIS